MCVIATYWPSFSNDLLVWLCFTNDLLEHVTREWSMCYTTAVQRLLDSRSLKFIVSLTLHDRTTKSLLHLHKKKKPPSISAQFQVTLPFHSGDYKETPVKCSLWHKIYMFISSYFSDFFDQAFRDTEQSRALLHSLYSLQCWEGTIFHNGVFPVVVSFRNDDRNVAELTV